MKVTMYGAPICPGCVDAHNTLKNHNEIELNYKNITESTSLLKEFLSYRDHEDIFLQVKKEGLIGIPFFVLEDGRKTFDMNDFTTVMKENTASKDYVKAKDVDVLSEDIAINEGSACSIDGNC